MNWDTIFLILCSIGAIQSFFIGTYFVHNAFRKRSPNLILGFLFLAVAIRVAKSTLWLFSQDVLEVVLNIGLAAHLAITPLLLLYLQSLSEGHHWHWSKWFHFLPTAAILMTSTILTGSNFWYMGGYSALLYHSLIYLSLAGFHLFNQLKGSDLLRKRYGWIRTIYLSVTVFCLAYFANYELGLTSYMTGPVIYSGIIYYLSYYVLSNHSLFDNPVRPKYRNIQISKTDVALYSQKVKDAIEKDQLYLQPEFTLSQLSQEVAIPKHLLSNLFNMHLKMSFTDYTNRYRIEKAIKCFESPQYDHQKISAIAYECGFNTLSAFNAAFKKNTNYTPSAYRKNLVINPALSS